MGVVHGFENAVIKPDYRENLATFQAIFDPSSLFIVHVCYGWPLGGDPGLSK